MNLLTVYESILRTCGYEVDDDGIVRKATSKKKLPVTMTVDNETRTMCLPTQAALRSENSMAYIFFHPFQENLIHGESRIMAAIRKELIHTYGVSVAAMMDDIVKIAAGAVEASELTMLQRDFISKLGPVDQRFTEDFFHILEKLAKRSTNNTPIMLSLRKGAEINGEKYSRAAIWSSPLVEEIKKGIEESKRTKDTPKILGVSIRKKDIDTYLGICDAFFPKIDTKDNPFFAYSNATDAPYCEAFVRSLRTLPEHLNNIAKLFYDGKHHVYSAEIAKQNLTLSLLDIDWIGENFSVNEWAKEYRLIPMQDGSDGIAPVEDRAVALTETKEKSARKWGDVTEQSHQGARGHAAATRQPEPAYREEEVHVKQADMHPIEKARLEREMREREAYDRGQQQARGYRDDRRQEPQPSTHAASPWIRQAQPPADRRDALEDEIARRVREELEYERRYGRSGYGGQGGRSNWFTESTRNDGYYDRGYGYGQRGYGRSRIAPATADHVPGVSSTAARGYYDQRGYGYDNRGGYGRRPAPLSRFGNAR